MDATNTAAGAPARFVRYPATWFGYLLIATQIYLFNVQGNVIPFLQTEFTLSYRVVSLHSSAMALGVIITSLFGNSISAALGRRMAIRLGGAGLGLGALLLCVAPAAWASIASCLLMGLGGGLVPAVIPAIMADLHGEQRGHAFSEQAILAYAFALVGPLSTGLFVAAGFGWRPSVIFGGLIALTLIFIFRNVALPERKVRSTDARGRLPPPFWAYWVLLFASCSFEFSVVLWAPTFLERVVGYSASAAAALAAGFFIGVLAGRIALRFLVERVNPRLVLFAAFACGLAGFALYWGIAQPWSATVGIVLLGLCVAPQYPLIMALGLGATGGASDAGAARFALAFGLAVLIAPAALGALADLIGLRLAHLTLPALIAGGFAAIVVAGMLERRHGGGPPAALNAT